MKRRLFLKTGSIGIGGMVALPTVIYGCASLKPIPQGPSMAVSLFQDGSRSFDAAVAELRLAGSGELASAEAEDVLLTGTAPAEVGILDIAEQVSAGQAAVPAELNTDFTVPAEEMINAAEALNINASELSINSEISAELAEDFIWLKVVKASTLLASAAKATPRPVRKVTAAKKMVHSAKTVHSAMIAESTSELTETTGSLLAHSEEFVGAAESYSAEIGFIDEVATFESSVSQLQAGELVAGVSNLLTSTDNIALSSEYFVNGIDNLNAESEFFEGPIITSAEELIPSAEQLVEITPLFVAAAESQSAEAGAEKMTIGAGELLTGSVSEVEILGIGGETLDIGADQFIGGEITYNAEIAYDTNSGLFLKAAEDILGGNNSAAEAEHFESVAEQLYPASSEFYGGAEALQKINLTGGVESMVPAAEELLFTAELLKSEAGSNENAIDKMLEGAAEAIQGAEQSESSPSELLEIGAESIESGTLLYMSGAEEFIEGYN